MDGFVNKNIFDSVFKRSHGYANFNVNPNDPDLNKNKTQIKPAAANSQNQSDNFTKSEKTNTQTINAGVDNVIDTVTVPNQTKSQRIKTFCAIGASTVVISTVAMFLAKGNLSKSTANLLGKFINDAAQKIELLKQKPNISKVEGFYLGGLQKVNRFANRFRGALFNMTPVKDVIFKRFAGNTCKLKKPCDKVTEEFRKLSFGTVKSCYKSAENDISNMTLNFSALNKRIASGEFSKTNPVPAKDVVEKLNKTNELINTEFKASFNADSINARSEMLQAKFENLDDNVYESVYGKIKNFVSDVNEWTTFVSEKLVENDKKEFMSDLSKKRNIITRKPKDNYKDMSSILGKLDYVINPQHEKSRTILKNMRNLTNEYVELSGVSEKSNRIKIVNEINKNIKEALTLSTDACETPKQTKKFNALLKEFSNIINSDKKGAIEQILTEYKKYLPEEEYKKIKQIADRASASLNNAVHKEGFEYVDKLRDLSIGSALTDVAIGMGVPVVSTSIAMSKAETKEKKRSVALKYGVPLVLGVATSTLCTIQLISGGKALLFGSAVTFIGNEICERLDNYILKKEKNRNELQSQQNLHTNA